MKRALSLLFIAVVTVSTSAQFSQNPTDIPSFNPAPPSKTAKLAPILSGNLLTGPSFGHPAQVKSYKEAARYAAVLHQLPCYWHCDRNHGHASLRTSFESNQG